MGGRGLFSSGDGRGLRAAFGVYYQDYQEGSFAIWGLMIFKLMKLLEYQNFILIHKIDMKFQAFI
jgi:hypothetical protein